MNWETYIAFGDSITIGARSYLGYPEVAGAILEQSLKKQWNISNFAKSGITTIELARRIDMYYSHLKDHQASISTILIGTNDIKNDIPKEQFEVALNLVITKVKLLTQHAKVLLVHIPKLQKGIMYPYNIEMNAQIAEYNESIARIAIQHNIKDIKLELNEEHFFDGVHLNNSGVQFAGNQIANIILKERGL